MTFSAVHGTSARKWTKSESAVTKNMDLFNLGNAAQRQDFKAKCNQLYLIGKEKGVWVRLTQVRRTRTLPQNAYLHKILGMFAEHFGLTLEVVKEKIFKEKVNREIFLREMPNNRFGIDTYLRSSASLDTKEMSLATERFIIWSENEADFLLPRPEDFDALMEAQQRIEEYAKYL